MCTVDVRPRLSCHRSRLTSPSSCCSKGWSNERRMETTAFLRDATQLLELLLAVRKLSWTADPTPQEVPCLGKGTLKRRVGLDHGIFPNHGDNFMIMRFQTTILLVTQCWTLHDTWDVQSMHGDRSVDDSLHPHMLWYMVSLGVSENEIDRIPPPKKNNLIGKMMMSRIVPIGSMVLVYMLTLGVYWWDPCYHIWHTWILWGIINISCTLCASRIYSGSLRPSMNLATLKNRAGICRDGRLGHPLSLGIPYLLVLWVH